LSAARSLATCVGVASSSPVAYLDSSALVKLIAIEAETAALRQELRRWPDRVSSLLATVEVTRTARRLGGHALAVAAGVLAGLRLLAIEPIVPAAAQVGGTTLRSLDAIHLATAASIAHQLGALITYDQRMVSEAQTLGLPVLSPA
jgi:predicted nucleic acid-binding protein